MADMDDREYALQRQRRGGNALSNVRFFPKPGPKLYMAGVWWAFGLYALFLAKAPFTPSLEAEQFYSESIFSEQSADAQEAEQMYVAASRRLDAVHVFGWRWRPPYDQQVPLRKEELAHAQARYDAAVREHNALRSEAKAAVGIWSQYGVDEVRERFWKAYQSGKDFAKRMTFWDVMFGVGGRGRDEELAGERAHGTDPTHIPATPTVAQTPPCRGNQPRAPTAVPAPLVPLLALVPASSSAL